GALIPSPCLLVSSTPSDHCPVEHHGPLGNDDDAVADDVVRPLGVPLLVLVDDAHVRPDAAVLVEDGLLYHAPVADDEGRHAAPPVVRPLLVRLDAVGPDDHRVGDRAAAPDARPHADDAVGDARPGLDDAAVAHQALLQVRAADARRRQVTHARVDNALGA